MSTNSLANRITGWLFQTGAIRVSSPEQPFWYTSGLIGPYYVNTHFLYGNEQLANGLLALIDENKHDLLNCATLVRQALWSNYQSDPVFKQVTDAIVQFVREHYTANRIDGISGGERRDWFFSILPAEMLGLPHLTVFKDQQAVIMRGADCALTSDLSGQQYLHISDLITEASSYVRAWIPALTSRGASMLGTVTIVDRQQGGAEALSQNGVPMRALAQIGADLFQEALAQGHLTPEQHRLVSDYLADPHGSMRTFLVQHPEFLQRALAADPKSKDRAKLLLQQDLYQLPAAQLQSYSF